MKDTGRKILKAVGLIILFVITGLLFIALFLALVNSRKTSFDDSDLIYVRPQIPVESNAFYTLLKATNELFWPDTNWFRLYNLSDNTNWNDSLAAEVLEKNRASMNLFNEAMQQPFLLVPEPQALQSQAFDDEYSYLTGWRDIVFVQAIHINSLHRANKDKEALDLAFQIINFGQRVENSGGPILHYLVGSGIKAIGMRRIQELIADTTLDETDLAQAISKLNDLGPNQEGLTNALKVEYETQRNLIDDFAQGTIPDETNSAFVRSMTAMGLKLVLNGGKTKMDFAQEDRFLFSNFSKPYAEIPWSNLPNMDIETNDAPLELLASGNAIGDILYAMMAPSVESFAKRKCSEDVNVTATQILLALKIYKMRQGKLPESLSELVPEYFPSVPLDDFDGKPFRYLPDKKIIYSVGPCLKDLGGKERKNESPDYNLPFNIEF